MCLVQTAEAVCILKSNHFLFRPIARVLREPFGSKVVFRVKHCLAACEIFRSFIYYRVKKPLTLTLKISQKMRQSLAILWDVHKVGGYSSDFRPAYSLAQLRKYLKCEYTTVASPSSSSTLSNEHYNAVQEPAYKIPSKFPAVFFLDADIFQRSHLEIPKVQIPVPGYVREVVGDDTEIRNVAVRYFDTIHSYFPIVSKQRFYSVLMNPLAQPRADVALLVLCMRLVTSSYSTNDIRMASLPEYFTAKKFYSSVEAAGTCSTQVLQAGILIAFYEFAHAIYPAAYLSIGACARYGISYGMDEGGFPDSGALNWIEVEEKKRTWWAVLILDR